MSEEGVVPESFQARVRELLTEQEQQVIRTARVGRRMGLGQRPAVLVIDMQNVVVGPPEGSTEFYPIACGEPARAAVPVIAGVLDAARSAGAPVVYLRWEILPDGSDMGVFRRKREFVRSGGFGIAGTEGVEFVEEIKPHGEDLVLTKKKFSAFFGTPLLSALIDRGVDTVIVVGGSTSNCVRATVVDASSFNFRVAVVEDGVFDRVGISHRMGLLEMDARYADVMASADVIAYLESLNSTAT